MTAKHKKHGEGHNSLFRPGPNYLLNACVGLNGGWAGLAYYARGYFEAGKRLVESLQENRFGVDGVIYPLVMIYRHGVEVALKHLAMMLPALCDEHPTGKPKKPNHKLMDEWKLVRLLLAKVDVPKEELEEIEGTLKEIVEMDPNGVNFRFPRALDGTRSLELTTIINVEVFGERMAHLAEFLENCWGWVEYLYDQKCEFEREMGDGGGWC